MWAELKKDAEFELGQIQRLFDEYKELLSSAKAGHPDKTELLALAGILHSFYNGIGSIFKRIASCLDAELPRKTSWHRDLLDSMATETSSRPPVISQELHDQLDDYLRFRHRFRHSYSFQLVWEDMRPLVLGCEETLKRLEAGLQEFLKHKS